MNPSPTELALLSPPLGLHDVFRCFSSVKFLHLLSLFLFLQPSVTSHLLAHTTPRGVSSPLTPRTTVTSHHTPSLYLPDYTREDPVSSMRVLSYLFYLFNEYSWNLYFLKFYSIFILFLYKIYFLYFLYFYLFIFLQDILYLFIFILILLSNPLFIFSIL